MKIDFEFEGQSYQIECQNVRGQLWAHFQGRTFAVNPETVGVRTRKKSSSAKGADLHSPMPGKITKILKSEGDMVQPGESVVMMEAMKMEYTLKAEKSGVIKKVFCRLQEQVPLGHKLVQIEEVSG